MVPNPSVRTICCPYTNFDDIMVWLNVGLEVFIGQVSKCRIEKLCMAYTSNSTKIFKRWNIGFDERVCFEGVTLNKKITTLSFTHFIANNQD